MDVKIIDDVEVPRIEVVRGRSFRVLRTILAALKPPEDATDTTPAEWRPLEIESIVTEEDLRALNCDIGFLIRTNALEELKYVGLN